MEQLVLEESDVAALLNSPDIRAGDSKAFQNFSLYVDLLVGACVSRAVVDTNYFYFFTVLKYIFQVGTLLEYFYFGQLLLYYIPK